MTVMNPRRSVGTMDLGVLSASVHATDVSDGRNFGSFRIYVELR